MNDDLHSQAYLYAVEALEPEEIREYEAHLADCPDCQKEVADMRELTAQLSDLAAAEPPNHLRATVLAQIAIIPQDSAAPADIPAPVDTSAFDTSAVDRAAVDTSAVDTSAVDQAPVVAPVTAVPPRGGRHAAPVAAEPPAEVSATVTTAGSGAAGSSVDDGSNVIAMRPSWATRTSAAVAAVALIAAAIVGGWAINERNDARNDANLAAEQTAQLVKVLSAPDIQLGATAISGGGTASVLRSESQDVALLVTADLPELPSGKVYEAWTIKGKGDPVPAGTFEPADTHTAFTLTPAAVNAGAVALTVEPEGGSDQPTTPPIAAIDFSKA
jgi:hypothetical protein